MTRSATARIVRTRRYRPRLELLEQRLPPGDTILAGLLAHGLLSGRAAGLVPADERVPPPVQARQLAGARDAFALLPALTEAEAGSAARPREHAAAYAADRLDAEPFATPAAAAIRPAAAGVS